MIPGMILGITGPIIGDGDVLTGVGASAGAGAVFMQDGMIPGMTHGMAVIMAAITVVVGVAITIIIMEMITTVGHRVIGTVE